MCLAGAQNCCSSGDQASASKTPSLLAIMGIFGVWLKLTALLSLEGGQNGGEQGDCPLLPLSLPFSIVCFQILWDYLATARKGTALSAQHLAG